MASRLQARPGVTFAVERYWPNVDEPALLAAAAAARRAATAMRAEGRPIRLLDTFVIREEELVMTLFEAASAALAREAVERAGLPFDRITRLDRPGSGHLEPRKETQL